MACHVGRSGDVARCPANTTRTPEQPVTSTMTAPPPGQLVIISGPSGVGKTTVLRELLDRFGDALTLSVSATTRPPRDGETNGQDYLFLSLDEFEQRHQAGEFLECFEVFGRGYWYGTLFSQVTPSLAAGKWVILEIDVDGTQAVLERFPDAVTIFIRPSSLDELERRLRHRATDSEEAIERRLEVARREMALASIYRYEIVNDRDAIEQTIDEVCELMIRHGLVPSEENSA